MNRWDALSKIVESFNRQKRPGYALAAVVVFAVPVATLLGAVAVRMLH